MASDLLKDEGIDNIIANQQSNQIMPHLAQAIPVNVMVRKSMHARALAVLKNLDQSASESSPPEEDTPQSSKAQYLSKAFNNAILGVVFIPVICSLIGLFYYLHFLKSPTPAKVDYSTTKANATLVFIVLGLLPLLVFYYFIKTPSY